MMYMIDIRRKSKRLLEMSNTAKQLYGMEFDEFCRLACISSLAVEVTHLDSKRNHYATDMNTLNYIRDEILNHLGDDYDDKEYRDLTIMVSVAGNEIRRATSIIDIPNEELRNLDVKADFLRGLIYAR